MVYLIFFNKVICAKTKYAIWLMKKFIVKDEAAFIPIADIK